MNYKFVTPTVAGLIFLLPLVVLAADPTYTPLVGIPGVTDPGLEFGDYINALYALSISIAALLAVIKIVIAGMKYMLSDIVTSKSDAIKDIQGAVFGLIVVISAVLILTVINPNLTETEIFLDQVEDRPGAGGSGSGSGSGGGGGGGSNYNGPAIPQPTRANCLPDAFNNNKDCTVPENACKAVPGIPQIQRNTFSADEVICRYGKLKNFPCSNYDNATGGYTDTYDCTEATAKCIKVGTPYPNSIGTIIECWYP